MSRLTPVAMQTPYTPPDNATSDHATQCNATQYNTTKKPHSLNHNLTRPSSGLPPNKLINPSCRSAPRTRVPESPASSPPIHAGLAMEKSAASNVFLTRFAKFSKSSPRPHRRRVWLRVCGAQGACAAPARWRPCRRWSWARLRAAGCRCSARVGERWARRHDCSGPGRCRSRPGSRARSARDPHASCRCRRTCQLSRPQCRRGGRRSRRCCGFCRTGQRRWRRRGRG